MTPSHSLTRLDETSVHRRRVLFAIPDRALAAQLAAAFGRRLRCDVTIAHDLRTAWSLRSTRRWGAVIACAALPDGPGLALLSATRTDTPEALTALLIDLDPQWLGRDELGFIDLVAHVDEATARLPVQVASRLPELRLEIGNSPHDAPEPSTIPPDIQWPFGLTRFPPPSQPPTPLSGLFHSVSGHAR